ncbi:MAG: hypothetical protein KAX87_04695, partial [Nitrospira sp.]|nr:hypothetical protein [Nitrospira sp.]
MITPWQVIFLAWVACAFTAVGAAAAMSDEYIAGYAAATLEHEFHLSGAVIEVDRGAVTVQVK